MLSHRNLMANTVHWLVALQQGREDVFLIMAPMFHAAGSVAVLATVWVGGRQVILPGFDPVAALDTIAAEGITIGDRRLSFKDKAGVSVSFPVP